jgi:hypothetical protein
MMKVVVEVPVRVPVTKVARMNTSPRLIISVSATHPQRARLNAGNAIGKGSMLFHRHWKWAVQSPPGS